MLLAVGDARTILRQTFPLLALTSGTRKTFEMKLLAKGQASGVEGRLIQSSRAAWLAKSDGHEYENSDKDRATDTLFHEVLLVRETVGNARPWIGGTINFNRCQVNDKDWFC
jgi:hypothetical protein